MSSSEFGMHSAPPEMIVSPFWITPPRQSSKTLAILNPEHLLEQANRLIAPPPAGPPRQVDVRRAISAAYYAVFHATLAAAADQLVGVTKRASSGYTLVYRSIDHKELRELFSRWRPRTY